MPLDPQLAALLKTIGNRPPPAGLTTLRATLEANAIALPGRKVDVADVRNIELQGPHGPINARLYKPRGRYTPPLTVYYHGGGALLPARSIPATVSVAKWPPMPTQPY
jgi:acetyl esterase